MLPRTPADISGIFCNQQLLLFVYAIVTLLLSDAYSRKAFEIENILELAQNSASYSLVETSIVTHQSNKY